MSRHAFQHQFDRRLLPSVPQPRLVGAERGRVRRDQRLQVQVGHHQDEGLCGGEVRVDPYIAQWAEVDGDGRPALVPYVWYNYWRGDAGRSESFNGNAQLTYRVTSQFNTSLIFDCDP